MNFIKSHDLYNNLLSLCQNNEAFYFTDQSFNGRTFRIFNYRLASYSDFLVDGAIECRGHTFLLDDGPIMVSRPMEKFFNLGENPFTMNLDLSRIVRAEDKRDGSLISTVTISDTEFLLKSKGSLYSSQAMAATEWLDGNDELKNQILAEVSRNNTVNMEWTSPYNRIVLGYQTSSLRVLNIRNIETGNYVSQNDSFISKQYWVDTIEFPQDQSWIEQLRKFQGIEGVVLWFDDDQKVKIKTDWYFNLHLQKEQVANPRRLFESVLNEESDDLKSLFIGDDFVIKEIENMEQKAKSLYNHLHKIITSFYDENKNLSKKDYAIKGQKELNQYNVFSLAMNLYIGRDIGLKEYMIKNYKYFGITDVSPSYDTQAS